MEEMEWENYKFFPAIDIKTAVQQIAPYLEDTSDNAPEVIYFGGWAGLGASAVLRDIAEHPPPSLLKKFNKIVHIDCSMWKNRRALQRVIADGLKLTEHVAAIDAQDEEDDFSGVDHGSRAELRGIMAAITRYLAQYRCLVVFHNGSDVMVDLTSCGIPQPEIFNNKVLWTFGGRLRLTTDIVRKLKDSRLNLYAEEGHNTNWNACLIEEANEIALHTHKLGLGVTSKIATECCLYLLTFENQGKKMIDYNWATHASSYWVCDGIIGGQDNQAWEIAQALQQHIRLEDYSSNTGLTLSARRLGLPSKQWISSSESYLKEVPLETTTLFFAPNKSSPQVVPLTSDKFHKADQLRVLKLYKCTFNFSSPPFYCCHNLRFLGLDRCKDELQQGEEKTCEQALEIFQRLWVLDVCHTDWPLALPPETKEKVVATYIREVHIANGRIWHNNHSWKQLPNLHKLRVVKPTNPWETYQELPSSLESFSLDTGKDHENEARISRISLAGCTILSDFILRGSLPNLEELDLSHTAIKILDLGEVVQVKNLQRLFLMGCGQLRSISWPKTKMSKLRLLCIDTRAGGGEVANKKPWSHDCSLMVYQQEEVKEYCHASIAVADMRFLQSLEVLWTWETIQCNKWNICLSSTSSDDRSRRCHKDKTGHPSSSRQLATTPSLPKSLTYHDVSIEPTVKIQGGSSVISSTQLMPLNLHIEIGEGISDVIEKASNRARFAIWRLMDIVQSLHVHDSSSMTTIVVPEESFRVQTMNRLVWCCVERCPMLDTIFTIYTDHYFECFSQLVIFWASHLLMAHSIWSRPRNPRTLYAPRDLSFTRLRGVRLFFCPRLRYVLPMASNNTLSKVLRNLFIHCCGDLRQVFHVEQEFLKKIAASHEKGMLEFSNLNLLYLYELPNLQQICEAKIFAPKLETIYIRGCWSLRRLPATDSRRRQDGRPVAVDCEKDWWDKLEWDGMESGHHPSLFKPCHSKYYKRRHLRTTVLR